MERCRDCKHWADRGDGWGYCDRAAGIGGDAEYPESLAYACDCEAYCAFLLTSPDFGCVQFAAKDDVLRAAMEEEERSLLRDACDETDAMIMGLLEEKP